jgi:hypothetical protein
MFLKQKWINEVLMVLLSLFRGWFLFYFFCSKKISVFSNYVWILVINYLDKCQIFWIYVHGIVLVKSYCPKFIMYFMVCFLFLSLDSGFELMLGIWLEMLPLFFMTMLSEKSLPKFAICYLIWYCFFLSYSCVFLVFHFLVFPFYSLRIFIVFRVWVPPLILLSWMSFMVILWSSRFRKLFL